MQGGYHPSTGGLGFTAIILLEPDGLGTLYRAIALHRTPDDRADHEKMGFHSGWGTAATQLDALATTL
jgi:uncharacterized protein YndB with AHSA1/START domain